MAKRNRNKDKNMNIKQTKNSNLDNTSSNMDEHPPRKKRKYKHETEGIAMSKQLQMKLKARSDISTNKGNKKSNRVCANGKPLPSLKDLELLFEDSDEDDGDKRLETNTTAGKDTPEVIIISDPDSLFSPTTRAKITQQAKEILANSSKLNGKETNVPDKKKSKIPDGNTYDVCDLTLSSDEGKDDNEKQNNKQETNKHRPDMFDCEPYNNSQDLLVERISGRRISSDSNNTLEYAINVPKVPSPVTSNTYSASEAFEPLPSTSKDDVTFVKNVELFNMRFKNIAKTEDVSVDKDDEDLQIIEIPGDVAAKDRPENTKTSCNMPEISVNSRLSDNVIEIDSDNTNVPVLNNSKNKLDTDTEMRNLSAVNMTGDTIEVESEILNESTLNNSDSAIPVTLNVPNDGNETDSSMQNQSTLNNVNVMPNSSDVNDDDVCLVLEPESSGHHNPIDNNISVMNNNNNTNETPIETIDVDALIAQNQTLLNKYQSKRSSSLNSVVDVSAIPGSSHGSNIYPYPASRYKNRDPRKCNRCELVFDLLCPCRHGGLLDIHERLRSQLNATRRKYRAYLNKELTEQDLQNVYNVPNRNEQNKAQNVYVVPNHTQQKNTQSAYDVPNYASRASPTANTPSVLDSAEQPQQLDTNGISHGLANCVKTIDSETKTDPITPQEQLKTSDLYTELMTLEHQALLPNTESFECEVCTEEYLPGCGVVLRECVHIFCKECLADVVRHCEEPEIACPALGCQGKLQQREIRALVTPQDYDKWLARGLAAAESGTRNAFHCRTRDCNGWALCEPGVRIFPCPVCKQLNCVTCQAIHDDETCEQYQYRLRNGANNGNAEIDEKTRKLLNSWLAKGTAMKCPECSAILTKALGCDWIKCSACKTEICWATRGRRWGPRGRGDTSGGCRCRVKRKRCHPTCRDCH